MDEIRFTEASDDYLVLETADGLKFKLQIDDQVRSAIRRSFTPNVSSANVSPREIQERVRSGSSIAQIAEQSRLSVDLVEKFAAPVLDEIAFVVNTALSVRLTFAGSRPNTTEQVEFGEVIASRLRASGAANVEWSALKLEGSTWRLRASFELASEAHEAAWLFEPKKLTLAPDNDMAIRLSTEETVTTKPSTPLRVVEQEVTIPSAVVVAEHIPNDTAAAEFEHQVDVDSASTTDLLEALRKKRESRKAASTEPTPVGQAAADPSDVALETEAPEAEVLALEALDQTQKLEPIVDAPVANEGSSKPAAKKSRASMPSWDEIVFGAKADD